MSPFKEGRSSLMSCTTMGSGSRESMEEDSLLSSPPRSLASSSSSRSRRSRLSLGRASPEGSRRLFEEDDEAGISPPTPRLVRPLVLHLDAPKPPTDANCKLDDAALAPFQLPPMHGRKRTSTDRRNSPSADANMHLSPHMSPNSFLTMDGRFVHSKNPFSSPMMMDDDSVWASAVAPGPSMPVSFYPSDTNSDTKMALIPPRSRPALNKRNQSPNIAMGDGSLFAGFPDKRFSFTGSPIHENMETETAASSSSAAALSTSMHKVRRLHRNDDIVAAGYRPSQFLSVDTRHSPTQKDGFDDGISPTEVCNFPPPTPVKTRPNQSAYASIRLQEPTTPFVERRTATNSCRTPHPGSYINNTDAMMNNAPKSRFHTDFDIIEEIGKGCFGTVYKVLSRLDGCMYAIKKGRRPARGEMEKDRMLKEVCKRLL